MGQAPAESYTEHMKHTQAKKAWLQKAAEWQVWK